jgi:SAM-dependent methyltransferase
MTYPEFLMAGEALSEEARVAPALHEYFRDAASRLYLSCEMFGLLREPLGDVLEIGPYYGYIPFILRKSASSYKVLEGDDPAIYSLEPLYKKHSIHQSYIDFFELFCPVRSASYKLPFADASFDKILCWETMEHFSFNPVKFVREIHRILRPGGKVYVTVPNKASFQRLVELVTGFGEHGIRDYFKFEDYESNGKKAFYGFHWREYTSTEFRQLFATVGFTVDCRPFTAFHDHGATSFSRRIVRSVNKCIAKLIPRYATNIAVVATKQSD